MQQYPLLQTKLYIPPIRPELVSRPRLIERLNAGLPAGRKLTLVSAPAGFGKTDPPPIKWIPR
jgi:LuxR family maltose regulon positive regulatory protein